MAKEREIKLRIVDVAALRRDLKKLGARMVSKRMHEHNLIFDTPAFALAKREQLLRIRAESPASPRSSASRPATRFLLTFKEPVATATANKEAEHHKVREETELEISAPQKLQKILEKLGLRPWFHYEKFRTTYRLPAAQAWAKALLIELDETPIGAFLELEGPAKAIDRAAQALGFQQRDYILSNYLVLYREYCSQHKKEPRHMLFAPAELRFAAKKSKISS